MTSSYNCGFGPRTPKAAQNQEVELTSRLHCVAPEVLGALPTASLLAPHPLPASLHSLHPMPPTVPLGVCGGHGS